MQRRCCQCRMVETTVGQLDFRDPLKGRQLKTDDGEQYRKGVGQDLVDDSQMADFMLRGSICLIRRRDKSSWLIYRWTSRVLGTHALVVSPVVNAHIGAFLFGVLHNRSKIVSALSCIHQNGVLLLHDPSHLANQRFHLGLWQLPLVLFVLG